MTTAFARESPSKRRSILRWQENRLRRLDAKLASCTQGSVDQKRFMAAFNDTSNDSLTRCKDRAHQLACLIQVAWGKREAARLRVGPY